MFQFNSNPLQLNLDYNIPDATHPKEEYNEETVVADSSSSFSDVVYNYHTNASFSSFDSGVESFGIVGLPNSSQLYPIEQSSMFPVDTIAQLNTVPFPDASTSESSSSGNSYQPNLQTLTPDGGQYIDPQLLNMPNDAPQPPFSASMGTISSLASDQFAPSVPNQEYVDTHFLEMRCAAAETPHMYSHSPVQLDQQPVFDAAGEFFGEYNVGGGLALATSNVGGSTVQASYSLETFIATYPNTSVVYGVTAPGQAPARAIMTTASTSGNAEGPPSAPAVAPPAPALKSTEKRSRPRKAKSSLSTTRKHVKASAPTSKVPCLFPGCNRRFYDEKTRQRHASTHNDIRPGFFCPGMYLPRVDCAKCNCNEAGYTREDALVRHLKSIEPFNPCVLEAERLGWSANVKGSAKNLRGYRPVKPVIANTDAGAES